MQQKRLRLWYLFNDTQYSLQDCMGHHWDCSEKIVFFCPSFNLRKKWKNFLEICMAMDLHKKRGHRVVALSEMQKMPF